MDRGQFLPNLLCGLILIAGLIPAPVFASDDTSAFIQKLLNVAKSASPQGLSRGKPTMLRAFYAGRNFRPVWVGTEPAKGRARSVLAVLNGAASHGLEEDRYAIQKISRQINPKTSVQRAQLDILLSAALARYGADLAGHGRPPERGAKTSGRSVPRNKTDGLLLKAAAAQNLQALFDGLAPRSPRYSRLRTAYADYISLARRGGWPVLPNGPLLRRGMHHDQITVLRRRLTATMDLETGASLGDAFDAKLEAAVRRFQRRHGLAEDGIVGARTRAALNVTIHHRLQQLRINMKRRRAIPDDLGSHYVFVNMADYVLKVVKDERTVLAMKVIVGKPYRQTPLFSATITYVDFNPFWNIPRRIAAEEIAPRAARNVDYILRQGIRVFSGWGVKAREISPWRVKWHMTGRMGFPYRLRQDPGPLNPLGRVKFMFPNPFEVYLHDTPARQLFDRDIRAFSHGCIRIENPLALASHLLPATAKDQLAKIMTTGKRLIFRLSKPIPVHLTYLTSWVNKDGTVHFRKDIYRRDHRDIAALH